MPLIQKITRAENEIFKTYQAKNRNITHVLVSDSPYGGNNKKIVFCDKFDNPKRAVDFIPGIRKDTFYKAPDGSTIMQNKNKTVTLPHVIFNLFCERFMK